MNKYSKSVTNILEKFHFKNIKVIAIASIAVSIFLMFLTVIIPVSDGYSEGMAATIINIFTMVALIMLLIFVSTNSDFKCYFGTIVFYGVLMVIGLVLTILNFIQFLDFYNKGINLMPNRKAFFVNNMVLNILSLVSLVLLLVALVFLLISITKRQSTNTKTPFAIPLTILVVYFVINLVYFVLVVAFDYPYAMMGSVTNLLISASWVFFAAYLETRPKITADYAKESGEVVDVAKHNASLKDNKDYHYVNTSIGLHFFLTIITLGIWNYIGIFKLTRYLSSMNKEYYRDPITKLLLFMFIPFYGFYYYYKSGVIVDKLNRIPKGKSGTLLCILSIFFPGASFLVLINKAQQLEYTMPPQNNTQDINSVQ